MRLGDLWVWNRWPRSLFISVDLIRWYLRYITIPSQAGPTRPGHSNLSHYILGLWPSLLAETWQLCVADWLKSLARSWLTWWLTLWWRVPARALCQPLCPHCSRRDCVVWPMAGLSGWWYRCRLNIQWSHLTESGNVCHHHWNVVTSAEMKAYQLFWLAWLGGRK